METIPRTPARLARGKYLVEGLTAMLLSATRSYDFTQRPARASTRKKRRRQCLSDNAELGLPEPEPRRGTEYLI